LRFIQIIKHTDKL